MAKQYLDIAGLRDVINQIKAYYLDASASETPKVGWASNALSANSAKALENSHNFTVSGDVITASTGAFNGTQDVTISVTIADVVASTSGAGGKHGLMTAAQAEKLAGVATGAQVNVLESVSVTVASTTLTTVPSVGAVDANKNIAITLPQYALKTDVTASMRVKGVVDHYGDIATLDPNPTIGDVYVVRYTGTTGTNPLNAEYVYAASNQWEEFGNTLILEPYHTWNETKEYIDTHDWTAGDITDWASTTVAVQNAVKASQLATAQVINFTGDVNDTSISFNGTTAVTATLTIENGAISNDHIASDAAIAQSKIANLTTDLAAKMPKIGSTAAASNAGKVMQLNADGTITYGNKAVADLATNDSVNSAITGAINDLDVSTTTGGYLTSIGEANGKLTDIVWGSAAVSTTTSTTTNWRFAASENSKLVSAGEITKVLDGTGYITSLTVPVDVFDTTAY